MIVATSFGASAGTTFLKLKSPSTGNPFGEAKEIRNVIRGRDSRLDQERAFGAVPLVIVANPSGVPWAISVMV